MKKFFAFFLLGCSFIFLIAVVSLLLWLPSSAEIKGCITTKMYQVHLCPDSKDYVKINNISYYLKQAVVLTEDSSFYLHQGFDWDAIERNAREGIKNRKFTKGGSTITQQLAKNMFLTKDRTFVRKGLEALIAYRIEQTLSKDEILERYLNVVEFGKNIFGVKAAARYYFEKKPSEVSVVEGAFLALILPNPIRYSSSFYQKELTPFARRRIETIINNMHRYKRISTEEYEEAVREATYLFKSQPFYDDIYPEEDLNLEEKFVEDAIDTSLKEDLKELYL